MYSLALEDMHARGELDRSCAVRMLKTWHVFSLLAEADVSLGVARRLRKLMNISPLELEDPQRLLADPPPHVTQQRIKKLMAPAAYQARAAAIKQMEIFKAEDDGSGATVVIHLVHGDQLWSAVNDAFAKRMKEGAEMYDTLLQRKLLWMYLLVRFLSKKWMGEWCLSTSSSPAPPTA